MAAVTGPEDFLLLLPWADDESGDAALFYRNCRGELEDGNCEIMLRLHLAIQYSHT